MRWRVPPRADVTSIYGRGRDRPLARTKALTPENRTRTDPRDKVLLLAQVPVGYWTIVNTATIAKPVNEPVYLPSREEGWGTLVGLGSADQ